MLSELAMLQYLCNGLEDDLALRRTGSSVSDLDAMIAASGKMGLLFKLLPKLRAEGKKVGIPVIAQTSYPQHSRESGP